MGLCISKPNLNFKANHIRGNIVHMSLKVPLSLTSEFSHYSLNSVYNIEKVIGKGSFGIVRKATHKNNPALTVAIKSIGKNNKMIDYSTILREIEILKSIDHPNIIKFYECFNEQSFIHIVLEYCKGGELYEKIIESGKIQEKEAAKYMKKMLGAVNHLHLLGICHRDLKPQNFLFENDSEDAELKLIDFGLSNRFISVVGSQFRMQSCVGTPYYIAPEILQGNYDIKCDI